MNLKPSSFHSGFLSWVCGVLGMYDGKIPGIGRYAYRSNKDLVSESIKQIQQWDYRQIIVSHGEVVTENAREWFTKRVAGFWTG